MYQLNLFPQNGKIYLVKELSRHMKYTLKDLRSDFPNEEACLEWLISWLYPNGVFCVECDKVTKHYKIKARKVYSCSKCGHFIHPMSGTIFNNSHVPLTSWFEAIWMMSANKSGTSAIQISRHIGVTHATAWRMMHKIRSMMDSTNDMFDGNVEVDETYVHANTFKRSSARRRYGYDARRTGSIIFGMVHRESGHVKVWHVLNTDFNSLFPFIRENVKYGSTVYTDGYRAYGALPQHGFNRKMTDHGKHQWVDQTDKSNYTQNIENVWSHFKRGIKGVYRHISVRYLQLYADEYAWRYSHRKDVNMFWSLMGKIKN